MAWINKHLKAFIYISIGLVTAYGWLWPMPTIAGVLSSRTLTLGSAVGAASTTHKFDFTVATTGNVGSIKFQYCTTAARDSTCTTPSGLSTTSATLSAQSGAIGFTLNNTTNGTPYITRVPLSVSASTAVSYTLSGVTNPTSTASTFYVRIYTYASTDTTGAATDDGIVISSVADASRSVAANITESLMFCTGTSITGQDCSTIAGNTVALGVLSATSTISGTSVMAAATNANSGYAITFTGTTLTSGANSIDAITTPTGLASVTGTEQFGFNLKDNATPNVGAEPSGASGWTIAMGYNTADFYKFVSGQSLVTTTGPTNGTTFTVSYIANKTILTEQGGYNATLNFVCTATF